MVVAAAVRRFSPLITARPTPATLHRALPLAACSSSSPATQISRNRFNKTTIRAMSSEPQKYEWLVILPDQAGALARRMEVRQQHLANLQTYPPDFWLWGGGFLEDVPKEGEPMKMLGSAMLAWAASKEEVLEKLKKDVYTENQVWDWSKVQIYPFKSAIRKPL